MSALTDSTGQPPVLPATPTLASTARYVRQRERQGPVPRGVKILQGFGALPGSHKDFAFNSLLLLFYNQILGVPAAWASAVLAIALLVDAITDPLVGAYSDNFRSRLGRRHPFMYFAALPLGGLMFLLFSPPAGASQNLLIGWLLGITLLLRFAFTFFVVPWNALAAEFSQDYAERTSIVTYRALVGWIGGVLFAFGVYTFVFAPTAEQPVGQLNPDNYPVFAVVTGCLVTLWCLITTHFTRQQVPYLLQPTPATPPVRLRPMLHQVLLALGSSNFRLVFVGILLFAGVAGTGGVFDSYMNTYFWEFKPADLRWYSLTIVGAVVAFICVPLLQRRYEKQSVLVVALAAAMLCAMLKVTLRFADIWPANGDPLLLPLLIALASVQVCALTIAGIMFVSMMADMVDEQESRVGLRQEGVFSSAIGFSSKATSSLGLVLGGLLLDLAVDFPEEATPGAVDADVLFRLAFTDGIVVPVFYALPIYLLSRYSLTRDALAEVQAQVSANRRQTVPQDTDGEPSD